MGACCTKEARGNKLDAQEHTLSDKDTAIAEQAAKPLSQVPPNADDGAFFEQLAAFQSSNAEINVRSFLLGFRLQQQKNNRL